MEKKMEIWYAVSKSGQGRVFTSKPERNEHFGIWTGEHIGFVSSLFMWFEAEGLTLPEIGWGDEPIRMVLSLGY